MKEKNIKQTWNEFINQFKKVDLRYIHVALADVVFLALTFIGVLAWNSILSTKADVLSSLQNIQPGVVADISDSLGGFAIIIILSTIILLLYIIFVFSLTQGYSWSLIFNKKLNKNFIKRFFLLNLIAFPLELIFILIVIGILSNLTTAFISLVSKYFSGQIVVSLIATLFAIFILGPIFLYFMNFINIVYINFIKESKIFRSIKDAFKFVYNKGHTLYVPYTMSVILFFIISAVLLTLRPWPRLYSYVSIIFILLFSSWMRFYLKELTD